MIRRRRVATRYANRTVAGRALADELVEAALDKPVVLALPRGGVPVAAEVAARLNAQLGVILVRKIGVPGRSELAMGALAMVGEEIAQFRNDEIINGLRISSQAFDAARERERRELERRSGVFPSADLDIADATVILLERHFVMHNERQRTRTDAEGRFQFSGNDNHSLQLEAETAALGRSERRVVRLWFRAQNVSLAEPLRFAARLP